MTRDPLPVGHAVPLMIRTLPLDKTLKAGSRVRVTLKGLDDGTNPESQGYGSPDTAMIPVLNGYTATVHVDGSSELRLPVVTSECGIDVDTASPPGRPVPGCTAAQQAALFIGGFALAERGAGAMGSVVRRRARPSRGDPDAMTHPRAVSNQAAVDLSELLSASGSVTCCTLEIRR